MAAAKTKKSVTLWTPPGRVSFPFFTGPDVGRQYSDDKYKGDLLVPKAIFKEKGKELQDAVLQVGRDKFGTKFKLLGSPYKTPFKDTDSTDSVAEPALRNAIMIRAKAKRQPMFIGPRKDSNGVFPALTSDEIAAIKGGDWVLFNVGVFTYEQQGGGVSLGLNAVQYWKAGEGFGQGRSQLINTAEELEEEELEEASNGDVASDEEDSIV